MERERIGNYFKQRELGSTLKKICIVTPVSQPQSRNLFIMKQYHNRDQYEKQKKVFEIVQLYKNYYIQSFTHIKTTLNSEQEQYSKTGSLNDLGKLIKYFPLRTAKFYMYEILKKLKVIHYDYKVAFRVLYHSDIIFNEPKQLFIVGWSKPKNCEIKQKQLVYHCAEILFYMITNGVFQERGIRKQISGYNFLSQDFWDPSKSKSYIRFFPKQEKELSLLVGILKKMTLKNQKKTIEQLLLDPFFEQLQSFQNASSTLIQLQMEMNSKNKQRMIKQINQAFLMKNIVDTEKQKMQLNQIKKRKCLQQGDSQFRGSHQAKANIFNGIAMDGPIFIKQQATKQVQMVQNQQRYKDSDESQDGENQKVSEIQILTNLVALYFDLLLKDSQSGHKIFGEDWIQSNFNVTPIKSSHNLSKIQIQTLINYVSSQEQKSQSQTIRFVVSITWKGKQQQQQGQSCIQEYRIQCLDNLHEVLQSKFVGYLTEGLINKFRLAQQNQPSQPLKMITECKLKSA